MSQVLLSRLLRVQLTTDSHVHYVPEVNLDNSWRI